MLNICNVQKIPPGKFASCSSALFSARIYSSILQRVLDCSRTYMLCALYQSQYGVLNLVRESWQNLKSAVGQKFNDNTVLHNKWFSRVALAGKLKKYAGGPRSGLRGVLCWRGRLQEGYGVQEVSPGSQVHLQGWPGQAKLAAALLEGARGVRPSLYSPTLGEFSWTATGRVLFEDVGSVTIAERACEVSETVARQQWMQACTSTLLRLHLKMQLGLARTVLESFLRGFTPWDAKLGMAYRRSSGEASGLFRSFLAWVRVPG